MEIVYIAGGCLWGVQAYMKRVPGVIETEAGRANGSGHSLYGEYDGYVECVKTIFDPHKISVEQLLDALFDIIDPYSINQQGEDIGPKYRTGFYSEHNEHLIQARNYINDRKDAHKIAVEVKNLKQYVRSAEEHQDRLEKYPNDYCHIPKEKMNKYK